MKIYAPVKDFNGLRNNVRFVNGVGETDNMILVSWFQSRGYEVVDENHIYSIEKCDNQHENTLEKLVEEVLTAVEPNFDEMTPLELREWMKSNGYGSQIKNTRDKGKLLEIIRG